MNILRTIFSMMDVSDGLVLLVLLFVFVLAVVLLLEFTMACRVPTIGLKQTDSIMKVSYAILWNTVLIF